MNYYELLSIKKDATQTEVRAAYRRLVQHHHPDRSGEENAAEFRKIQEAYEVLSDPECRREYDRSLSREIPVRTVSSSDIQEVYEVTPGTRRRREWGIREIHPRSSLPDSFFMEIDDLLRRFFGF